MSRPKGWTIEEAVGALRALSPVAERAGYMLAMYGSVATKGEGADLDLLAVPWRPTSSIELLAALRGEVALQQSGALHEGAMGTMAIQFLWWGDRVIDLQIREVSSPYPHRRELP